MDWVARRTEMNQNEVVAGSGLFYSFPYRNLPHAFSSLQAEQSSKSSSSSTSRQCTNKTPPDNPASCFTDNKSEVSCSGC
jgi:hypothetical protein